MEKETKTRSIVKGVTYRFFGSLATFFVALLFTGNVPVAGGIGLLEFVSKIFLYYMHERFWNSVTWGRKDKICIPKGKKYQH